jgi:hypothetical protein
MVRKITYRYNTKERKITSLLPFELTKDGMGWKEIMKKYNLSHTETGRILNILLLNESIIKKEGAYFINPDMPPYWHELTFPNIFKENDSKILNSYKLNEIFCSNYIHLYGIDKRILSDKELVEINELTGRIFDEINNLKKIIVKNKQKRYIKKFNSIMDLEKYPKRKEFLLSNKKEIFNQITVMGLGFEDSAIRFRKEKNWFPFDKKDFVSLSSNNQKKLILVFISLQKKWEEIGLPANNIKIINEF